MTDLFNGTLNDSDTNETLTADDLGLTEEQYDALVEESIDCPQPEGHIPGSSISKQNPGQAGRSLPRLSQR